MARTSKDTAAKDPDLLAGAEPLAAADAPEAAAPAPEGQAPDPEPLLTLEQFVQEEKLEPFWQLWLADVAGYYPHTKTEWLAHLRAGGRE